MDTKNYLFLYVGFSDNTFMKNIILDQVELICF